MNFIKKLWSFLNRPEPEDLERIAKWKKSNKEEKEVMTKKQINKTLSSNF